MKSRWGTVALIVVAVAVVAGILYVAYRTAEQEPLAPTGPTTSTTAPGSPVFAPEGQIISGFPASLILDGSPSVDGSYSINYSASLNQYTAEWKSSSSMTALYEAYNTYLPAHGWAIVNVATKYPKIRGIYAQNASSDVSVAISAEGSGSQASVTYVIR